MAVSSTVPQISVPSSFSILNGLSDEELEALVENEDMFQELFDSLPQVECAKEAVAMLRAINQSAAESSLRRAPELSQAHRSLDDTAETLKILRTSLEKDRTALAMYSDLISMDTLLPEREFKCLEWEQTVQRMADSFLDGGLPVEDFVTEFVPARQRAVVSRLHIDKLKELLSRPDGGDTTTRPPPPPPGLPVSCASPQSSLRNSASLY